MGFFELLLIGMLTGTLGSLAVLGEVFSSFATALGPLFEALAGLFGTGGAV